MLAVNTDGKRYPTDVLKYRPVPKANAIHNTQKPVELLEFLIKTYTNAGETVLDPFMGSGSCGVACKALGRNFIGIEREPSFFAAAQEWINNAQ